MRGRTTATTGALLALALASVATPAALAGRGGDDGGGGNDRDVERVVSCSRGSELKLKLSPENGRVEVEVEVDENRNGSRWRVVGARNGKRVINRTAVTRRPSGSFELRRVVAPGSPRTRVGVVARRAATGEVCRATAVL
jgi:hypothetical protein